MQLPEEGRGRRIRARGLRVAAAAGLAVAAAGLAWQVWAARGTPTALDLNGHAVDPLGRHGGAATVLIFTRADCPISNRYAPQIQRLADRYAPAGVGFWLVYVDPDEEAQAIRRHLADYGYSLPALRDPAHRLVRRAGATVTPEAAVFDAAQQIVYCGRIDDLYADLDRRRGAPTRRDLEEALVAVLAGRDPEVTRTRAVGCPIADLK